MTGVGWQQKYDGLMPGRELQHPGSSPGPGSGKVWPEWSFSVASKNNHLTAVSGPSLPSLAHALMVRKKETVISINEKNHCVNPLNRVNFSARRIQEQAE
jgi:hypothetical protein